ncbi:thioredoxin [bacterium]|nr:thioredoxin [bacterium]
MSNLPQQLIDPESRKYLKDRFTEELKGKVKVDLFVGEENQEYVEFTQKLMEEIHEIEPRVILTTYKIGEKEAQTRGIETSPSLTIGWDKGYKVEYWGAPAGYETSGFVESIILVSKESAGFSNDIMSDIETIDKDVKLYSFVTPSCPYCPQSALQNHRVAVAKKGLVRSICVEAGENMDLAMKFNVSSVPQQNINDDVNSTTVGVQPEGKYIEQILKYGSSKFENILKERATREAKMTQLVDNPDYPLTLTDNNFTDAISKYSLIVVDCWAEWCTPCKMIAPVVEALSKEQTGKIVFGKLDTDKNPKISNTYGIRSIPTLLVFKNGEKVGQIVGARPKDALLKEIQKFA